jgi:hypothetical protein
MTSATFQMAFDSLPKNAQYEVKEDIKHNKNLSPAMNINETLGYLEKL